MAVARKFSDLLDIVAGVDTLTVANPVTITGATSLTGATTIAANKLKANAPIDTHTPTADTAGSFGDLTVASGVTGIGRFTIMFSSATAYCFTRTA